MHTGCKKKRHLKVLHYSWTIDCTGFGGKDSCVEFEFMRHILDELFF